mgnify:CR=1 FL=1
MTDVHIGTDRPTEAERDAIDRVVEASLGPGVVAESERLVHGGMTRRNERRHLLLPVLHALQNRVGWISPGALNHVAEVLAVPPAESYGVATFYDLFRVEDPGHQRDVTHVCIDAACQIAGAAERLAELVSAGVPASASPCLGQCERPVAHFVQGRGRPDSIPADAAPPDRSRNGSTPSVPQAGQPGLRVLRRLGGGLAPTSRGGFVAGGG